MVIAPALLGTALVAAPRGDVTAAVEGEPCPGADLGARIGELLELAGTEGGPAAAVKGELELEEGVYRLDFTLTIGGENEGSRTFRAVRCETVIEAAAFVVSVAIDPNVFEVAALPEDDPIPPPQVQRPTSAATPEPKPKVATADPQPATAAPEKPDKPPLGPQPARTPLSVVPFAVAAVGVDGGSLPGAGLLLTPRAGLRIRGGSIEAYGQFRTAARVEASLDPAAGGRVGAWAVGGRGCGLPPINLRTIGFPLCGGLEGGQVLASGFGFDGARDARVPWLALTAGAGLVWAFHPLVAVVLEAEVGASLLGGELVIDNLETLESVGPVFGRGRLGLEVRFRRGARPPERLRSSR